MNYIMLMVKLHHVIWWSSSGHCKASWVRDYLVHPQLLQSDGRWHSFRFRQPQGAHTSNGGHQSKEA